MIYEVLNKLGITYQEVTHQAIFTVADALTLNLPIKGVGCKNLFLKSNLDNYYLYLLNASKRADIKELEKFLGVKKLHFASITELNQILGNTQGSVSVLGIINDSNKKVTVIIDQNLINKVLLVHPDTNTKTIAIKYQDIIKYIEYLEHKYIIFSKN